MIRKRKQLLMYGNICLAAVWLLGSTWTAEAGPDSVTPTARKTQETPKPAAKAPTERLEFPGLTIDRKRHLVDLEATICLDRGPLELIACTKGTKEHESIVTVKAKPRLVHLGLLLIGVKNGKPAMRVRVEAEGSPPRWVDVPPSGDPIGVSLVFKNKDGKTVERPIGDFVVRTGGRSIDAGAKSSNGATGKASRSERAKRESGFPGIFLFAGSHVVQGKDGKGQYMADRQGNVISISTFGDEVVCLPGSNSKDNGDLAWEANSKTLPKVGTRVTLRLRPKAVGHVESD